MWWKIASEGADAGGPARPMLFLACADRIRGSPRSKLPSPPGDEGSLVQVVSFHSHCFALPGLDGPRQPVSHSSSSFPSRTAILRTGYGSLASVRGPDHGGGGASSWHRGIDSTFISFPLSAGAEHAGPRRILCERPRFDGKYRAWEKVGRPFRLPRPGGRRWREASRKKKKPGPKKHKNKTPPPKKFGLLIRGRVCRSA